MTGGFWRLWGSHQAQQFSAPLRVALSDSFLTALPFFSSLSPPELKKKKSRISFGPFPDGWFEWEVQGPAQQELCLLGPRLNDLSALRSDFSLPGIRKSCREVIIVSRWSLPCLGLNVRREPFFHLTGQPRATVLKEDLDCSNHQICPGQAGRRRQTRESH